MWIAIHLCMEATVGISLCNYLYLKLAKTLCLSYYRLCFLISKIREQEGRTGSAWKWGWGGEGKRRKVAQTMYTHVSKCKNDKIKERKKLQLPRIASGWHVGQHWSIHFPNLKHPFISGPELQTHVRKTTTKYRLSLGEKRWTRKRSGAYKMKNASWIGVKKMGIMKDIPEILCMTAIFLNIFNTSHKQKYLFC
jgi:hypothetical protein